MHFVDTNILLYAVSASPEDAAKRRRARALLEEGGLALSVQVLQEFYYQATHHSRPNALTSGQALRFLEAINRFPTQPITPDIFRTGVAISRRFGLSYWDSAILAAASAMGCEAVYSEDMNPSQDYNGLRVINSFNSH